MENNDFLDDMQDLVSAEDFLEYFDIPYDERVVKVNLTGPFLKQRLRPRRRGQNQTHDHH